MEIPLARWSGKFVDAVVPAECPTSGGSQKVERGLRIVRDPPITRACTTGEVAWPQAFHHSADGPCRATVNMAGRVAGRLKQVLGRSRDSEEICRRFDESDTQDITLVLPVGLDRRNAG